MEGRTSLELKATTKMEKIPNNEMYQPIMPRWLVPVELNAMSLFGILAHNGERDAHAVKVNVVRPSLKKKSPRMYCLLPSNCLGRVR